MSNKKFSRICVVAMTIATVVGVLILVFFSHLILGVGKIVGWLVTGAFAMSAGTIQYLENKREKEIAERELERVRKLRRDNRKRERQEQEERVQKAQEKAAQKIAEKEAKQLKIKAEMASQATTVWADKEKYAVEQENNVRKIIEETQDMAVRTLAGSVAIEWNEARSLAQWTAKQLVMFSQRPNVTTEAREEAQEAIIEVARIKASGNVLTEEQSLELRKKKEKAREEVQIEEDRLNAIQDVIENAERKWRVAELRANRMQDELEALKKK